MTAVANQQYLKLPYPWFGGKARIAEQVWERFADVRNYVEPFFGGGWCEARNNGGKALKKPSKRLPHLGNAGMGVHRPHQKRPHLGNAGRGVHRPGGSLHEYIRALSERLRRVRVCNGDWSRVCTAAPTYGRGLTAVFLDPPYSPRHRDPKLYAVETDVAADVRRWCLENGDNPLLRIALCGYAGEGHELLESRGWSVLKWKAKGGFANIRKAADSAGKKNARRERAWFSPHCVVATGSEPGELPSPIRQSTLFA